LLRVFVDVNVPLYASGKEHPSRGPCQAIIRSIATTSNAVTSAEMLQEVLHVCLRRGEALRAQAVLDDLVQVFAGRIEPLQARDVLAAASGGSERLSSRDRIHLAVMQRLGVDRIISTDQSFDGLPEVTRLNPLTFDSWREEVFGEAD